MEAACFLRGGHPRNIEQGRPAARMQAGLFKRKACAFRKRRHHRSLLTECRQACSNGKRAVYCFSCSIRHTALKSCRHAAQLRIIMNELHAECGNIFVLFSAQSAP